MYQKNILADRTMSCPRVPLQGKKVIRYPLNGTWIDIGTHQEYERAKELVKHLK